MKAQGRDQRPLLPFLGVQTPTRRKTAASMGCSLGSFHITESARQGALLCGGSPQTPSTYYRNVLPCCAPSGESY